jgi:acetyl-CoA carboxylase carboxyltransferase component
MSRSGSMSGDMKRRIDELRAIRETLYMGGGQDKTEKQHARNKLTARERVNRLLDPGSFVETGLLAEHKLGAPGDGLIAGHGTIDGRTVCVYSQDATVLGGTVGTLHGERLYMQVERALNMRVPLIGLMDSPGVRADRLDQPSRTPSEKNPGTIYFPYTQASGVIPQISAILGSCAGAAVYGPALTDFIFMVDGISHMFITGPKMIQSVIGEVISMDELGGAEVHATISGVCDFRVKKEDECFKAIRRLLSFLPSNNEETPPIVKSADNPDRMTDVLAQIVPTDFSQSYDMHRVIIEIVDDRDFLEVKPEFAPEMIVGFGRLEGHTVGFVANQSMVAAGSLTIDSSDKEARFIRFCDCFRIPLVFLIDTPAFLPGSDQEHGGIIRHGAKVLYALCEATVPRIAVRLRKCYGGGNLGMGALRGHGTDLVLAWPTAAYGVMGAKEIVELFYSDQYKDAPDPEEAKARLLKEYGRVYDTPYHMASTSNTIDDVIEPRETRWRLIRELQFLRSKTVSRIYKRHGNMPM